MGFEGPCAASRRTSSTPTAIDAQEIEEWELGVERRESVWTIQALNIVPKPYFFSKMFEVNLQHKTHIY